jgi:hypothetical protein
MPAEIVIVDDRPDPDAEALAQELETDLGIRARAITPAQLTRAHVSGARLILVDQRLDAWTDERDADQRSLPLDKQLIADRPLTGLAIAAIVRSHLADEAEPAGIALLSSNLVDLVKDFSRSATEHAAARLHDLEWAFDKRGIDGVPAISRRVVSLAAALPAVAQIGDADDPHAALGVALALPETDWAAVAAGDMHAAAPPIRQLAASTHGHSVVRWLSQRILPYPTFLIEEARVALALGIQPESFADHYDAIAPVLEPYRYRGPLAEFSGPRWWRAGVRRLARDHTAESRPSPELAAAIGTAAGAELAALQPPNAVLCVDAELRRDGGPIARERAVRVQVDDWPPFAETAWMSRDLLAAEPELWDMVDPSDRHLADT